ncbi:hypothetical protein [Shewanella sp. MMG014]|uniref:hypothetical protein n=1 Tax=Shewanella sp. MMG014 TaxID=2822691 RepID=UPI001B3983FD|nr:hypothetical protein [Shewanella sp. MMG014]
MRINIDNCMIGNKALASVLLLYYHLCIEGNFSGDETVYIDPKDFNGFDFLQVEIDSSIIDIDEKLIREGAIIYLLCDLNDLVVEHEKSFMSMEYIQKVLGVARDGKMSEIPETESLFELFNTDQTSFDFVQYNDILREIYSKYIKERINSLIG